MKERHKRRFSLPSLTSREVDAIDRRRLSERSELRSRRKGRGGMALKIFSKAESFRNLPEKTDHFQGNRKEKKEYKTYEKENT